MKRIFIDNGINNLLCKDTFGYLWDSFLDINASNGLVLENRKSYLETDYKLFLEFIGLGTIFKKRSPKLLSDIKSLLFDIFSSKTATKIEEINQCIDTAFDLCFNTCKNFTEITPINLILKHKEQMKYLKGKGASFLDQYISTPYLKPLKESSQNSHFDICRYLAWDLLIATLQPTFNEISIKKHSNINNFLSSLVALFHHILFDYGIQLNFFRLIEIAHLSTINQQKNNLTQKELEKEQTYLSRYKTSPKEDLVDCTYLDMALLGHIKIMDNEIQQLPVTILTMDDPIQVYNRLQIYRSELEKLQSKVDDWHVNPLYSSKVICLEKQKEHFILKDIVEHAILLS